MDFIYFLLPKTNLLALPNILSEKTNPVPTNSMSSSTIFNVPSANAASYVNSCNL